jgi:hypothetical protein
MNFRIQASMNERLPRRMCAQRIDDQIPHRVGQARGIAQHIVSAVLLFFFFLAVRNHFRIK